MKKFLIISFLIFCIFAIVVFFYTNTPEYKMKSFEKKFQNDITKLKPIYNKATTYCASQNFANRGPYTACMEEQIKNFSKESYEFFMTTQNFCESLTDNLADKWVCVNEVMD